MLYENIKNYRKLNNMSQDDLAEKLGVSRQSISLWETGQTQPTIDNIVALAKIFNVSADVLLDNGAGAAPVSAAPAVAEPRAKKKKPVWLIILIIVLVLVLAATAVCAVLLNRPASDVNGASSTHSSSEEQTESDTYISEVIDQSVATQSNQVPASSSKVESTSKIDLFAYCKAFAIKKGNLNGDYTVYRQDATKYGGYDKEYFSIEYWESYNKVEFCLYCPLTDTQAVSFELIMRGGFNGTYEYVSNRYYRSSGDIIRIAKGTIDPATFSDKYPLGYTEYNGDGGYEKQTAFLEESRVGLCDLVKCLKQFVEVEKMKCSFSDFGFKNF